MNRNANFIGLLWIVIIVIGALVSLALVVDSRMREVTPLDLDSSLVNQIVFEPMPRSQPVTITNETQIHAVITCLNSARRPKGIASRRGTNCRLTIQEHSRVMTFRMSSVFVNSTGSKLEPKRDLLLQLEEGGDLFVCSNSPFPSILAAESHAPTRSVSLPDQLHRGSDP